MMTRLAGAQLSQADLTRVYLQAADRAAEFAPNNYVIAVVDRDGRVLLVRRADGAGAVTPAERRRQRRRRKRWFRWFRWVVVVFF